MDVFRFVDSLEASVAKSSWARLAFFGFCTIITLGMLGYHFGTFDQASHIPFLRQMVDPSLYPGDPFLLLRFTKYSYFWYLFVPALKAGVLEYALFAVYVLSVFLTFAAIWSLGRTLFGSTRVATLSTLLLAFPHFGFGYFNLFEFSLVNRVAVFPLLLFSIILYLKGKYLWAWVLAGVLFNFHALTVIFVLIMYGVDSIFRWKEIGIRRIAGALFLFIGAALPVLVWKFSSTGLTFAPYWDWFRDVNQGLLMHVFSIVNVWPPFLFASVNGALLLGLTFVYLRRFPKKSEHIVMRNFLIAIAITVVVHTTATIVYPSVFVMQFQLLRISIFSIPFFYLYAASNLYSFIRRDTGRRGEHAILFGLLASSMTIFLYTAGEWLYRRKALLRWGRVLLGIQVVSYVGVIFFLLWRGLYLPTVRIFAPNTPAVDVELWAKRTTPKEAMFIAPPYLWSLYDADWRVFSERSVVVAWSELLELAFIPEYYPGWSARFDDMLPGVRAQFSGHFQDNQARIREIYMRLPVREVLRLKRTYGAQFFVTEKLMEYPFPLVYENAVFRVYDVREGQ